MDYDFRAQTLYRFTSLMIHALELKYFSQKGGIGIALMNGHEWVAIKDKKLHQLFSVLCSSLSMYRRLKNYRKLWFIVIIHRICFYARLRKVACFKKDL